MPDTQNSVQKPREVSTVRMLCLPAVVSTAVFSGVILANVIWTTVFGAPPFEPFRPPTVMELIGINVIVPVVLGSWFVALWGQILIPFAFAPAIRATWRGRLSSRLLVSLWLPIALGLVAAGVFWVWINPMELP